MSSSDSSPFYVDTNVEKNEGTSRMFYPWPIGEIAKEACRGKVKHSSVNTHEKGAYCGAAKCSSKMAKR